MMMNGIGMHTHMLLILSASAGLTYIVWTFARKETGAVKMIGQIIAAILTVLIIISLVVGGYMCASSKCQMCGMDAKHGKMIKMGKMMKPMPCPMMQQTTPEAKAKAK